MNTDTKYVIRIKSPFQYYSGGHVSCNPHETMTRLILARMYDSIGSAKTSIKQGLKVYQSLGQQVLDVSNYEILPVKVTVELI